MADTKPVAFVSFVNSDFQHEEGRIAQFRERLADEVSMHTGKELSIFQDRDDALWKQAWSDYVEASQAEDGSAGHEPDGPAFLISFITPRFFRSDQCRGFRRPYSGAARLVPREPSHRQTGGDYWRR